MMLNTYLLDFDQKRSSFQKNFIPRFQPFCAKMSLGYLLFSYIFGSLSPLRRGRNRHFLGLEHTWNMIGSDMLGFRFQEGFSCN